MKKVIVLVGPTASGKTKYSIALAKAVNAEIINGDSVQIYQELNIGSAKIKEEEKAGVLHHLFDACSIKKDYTVFNFQKDVRKHINDIEVPIIVGGTGFYIKAALYDYEFNTENNQSQFEHLTNEQIYSELLTKDPKIEIDYNNRHRLIRALQQANSGKLRSEKTNKNIPLYDILTVYLDIDRQALKTRLYERLDQQLKEGFIEEVKTLREQSIHLNKIGYRELDQYLAGMISLEEAKEAIINASMKLAKRQKTWFKNQMDVVMVDPLAPDASEKIIAIAKTFLGR